MGTSVIGDAWQWERWWLGPSALYGGIWLTESKDESDWYMPWPVGIGWDMFSRPNKTSYETVKMYYSRNIAFLIGIKCYVEILRDTKSLWGNLGFLVWLGLWMVTPHFSVFFKKYIYLFDCTDSWLQHTRSLVAACELLIVACGIYFPDQISKNSGPVHWGYRDLATGPLGKSSFLCHEI